MFDIFCHKITFVFQDTQIDVSDLIDLEKAAVIPQTKEQLITRLTKILDERKVKRESLSKKSHDEKDSPVRARNQDGEDS